MQSSTLGKHAVVVGGSMAGLLAARVLADHFDRVTVLERDRLSETPEARKGVPQARHVHVLLMSGRRVLERLFPGIINELHAAGASDMDSAKDIAWLTPAGWGINFDSPLRMLGATRDLIEWGVRSRVVADPRIRLRSEIDVNGLVLNSSAQRVGAVTVTDRSAGVAETLQADVVVDASGRGSKAPQWLEALGYTRPPETVINGFLGYSTRFIRKPANWSADWQALYIQHAPPARKRGGLIFPVEDNRWMVTLSGAGKDYPPTEEAEWWEFARSLPDPRFAAAIEAGEPLTPVVGTKSTENRLRHYEKLTRRPEGFLVTGDAACAFNPVYGQGMSTAALGALALDSSLGDGLSGLARRFQRRLAKSNANAWLVATGEDYRYAEVEGPAAGLSTRLLHRYLDRVTRLATKSAKVRLRLLEVLQLTRSPTSLFNIGVAARAALV
ncbi:MAG TPA: FAD-dependent monooxygenase [Gemmataceae bacterium]|nr:FAD-dependent monooxygenase [Gemmataceae bacterium]